MLEHKCKSPQADASYIEAGTLMTHQQALDMLDVHKFTLIFNQLVLSPVSDGGGGDPPMQLCLSAHSLYVAARGAKKLVHCVFAERFIRCGSRGRWLQNIMLWHVRHLGWVASPRAAMLGCTLGPSMAHLGGAFWHVKTLATS